MCEKTNKYIMGKSREDGTIITENSMVTEDSGKTWRKTSENEMKTVYVAIAYDNDLLAIGENKETVRKQAEENVKDNLSHAYSLDKYEVKENNGCFSFKLLSGSE